MHLKLIAAAKLGNFSILAECLEQEGKSWGTAPDDLLAEDNPYMIKTIALG